MWAGITGGILGHAGVNGFLDNLESVQQEADEESLQWEQFLRALVITFRGGDFATAEIVEHAVHQRGLLSHSFPDEVGHPEERESEASGPLQRRLGKALARKCGTRFGELELRVERARPDTHTKVQRWRIEGNTESLIHNGAAPPAGFQRE